MRLTVSKKDLIPALVRAKGASDPKHPGFSHAVFTADNAGLHISATDLIVGASTTVPATVRSSGVCGVVASALFDSAKLLPDGDIDISLDGNHVVIKSGKTRFRFAALPNDAISADLYPSPPEGEPTEGSMTLDAPTLTGMLDEVRYAVSTDDTKPHLAGILWERDRGTMRMVSTDGHRLAKSERASDGPAFKVLIPRRAADELRRFLDGAGNVNVRIAEPTAYFSRPGIALSARLSSESFPPYSRVIPKDLTKRVVVDRSLLAEAIKRGSSVEKDRVQLDLSDGIMKLSASFEAKESVDEVPVDYAGEGLTIWLNARYFAEAIGALTHDEIALELGGELDPVTVQPSTGNDAISVLMPRRA